MIHITNVIADDAIVLLAWQSVSSSTSNDYTCMGSSLEMYIGKVWSAIQLCLLFIGVWLALHNRMRFYYLIRDHLVIFVDSYFCGLIFFQQYDVHVHAYVMYGTRLQWLVRSMLQVTEVLNGFSFEVLKMILNILLSCIEIS